MTDLNETNTWINGIYQLETTDPVVGGPPNLSLGQGLSNVQAQQLASRTAFLKKRIDDLRTTESFQVEVGAGGDFSTIGDAIEELSRYQRGYAKVPVTAEITLRAGFVMEEAIYASGVDLSWMIIKGADEVTSIARDVLVDPGLSGIEGTYPAFLACNNGMLPIIDKLFEMDNTGDAPYRMGIEVVDSSAVIVREGAGVKSAGFFGAHIVGGTMFAEGAIFDGALEDGIRVTRVGSASFRGGSAKNCAVKGVMSQRGGRIDAGAADLSGAGENGVASQEGGTANIPGANCRKGSSDASSDIYVRNGGVVIADGSGGEAIGGTSIAPNTITSSGIIYK